MRKFILAVTAAVALTPAACPSTISPASAGTATATASANIVATPLKIVITGIAVDASWPANMIVMPMSTTGGNGKAVVYTFSGTPPADLVISGSNVVVGPNGVAPANGGTIENFSIVATQ